LRKREHSIGVKVNEISIENRIATAVVMPNSLKKRPTAPT
jgi:hypothetical protein